MPNSESPSELRSILFATLGIALKTLLSVVVYGMPLLGFWVASSLAAYGGGATWVPLLAGIVFFPVAPFAWDLWAESRRKRRDDEAKRILTFGDRILLRTFAITFTLLFVLLAAKPKLPFVALSTRGDWMLDGRHGDGAEKTRRVLFATAQSLEWLYLLAHQNKFADLADEDDDGKKPDLPEPAKPTPAPQLPSKPEREPAASAPPLADWPTADKVHPLVQAIPPDIEGSYEQVAKYVREREPDVRQRIKALHDYVADRIAYDAVALADDAIPTQEARAVFEARKGVCAGYANLLNAMAKVTGDEVVVVVGDSRSEADGVDGGGHAWNAAKIDGKWFLIDPTWDAGVVQGRSFEKRYSTLYLFTPPEVFGVDHLPDDSSWQLRSSPLTRGDFIRQPMLRANFFARGFRLERPDRSQVTVSDALEIALDNPRGQFVMATYSPKGTNSDRSIECEVRNGRTISARCAFPADGVFSVQLFANTERFGRFVQVATLEAVKR